MRHHLSAVALNRLAVSRARLALQLQSLVPVGQVLAFWGAGMMVASMEATLALWASSLREIKGRIRPLFTQERVAQSAGLFLDGLLGPERRVIMVGSSQVLVLTAVTPWAV